MNYRKKWQYLIVSCVTALVFTVGATVAFAQTTTIDNTTPATTFEDDGQPGFGLHGRFGDKLALLAEALGITVEELQAAQQQAHETAVQQALDEGLITQEQADRLLLWGDSGRGFGQRGFGRSVHNIDREALLADALDISVEALQIARDEAQAAGIQQALDEGLITQEQADLMQAAQALKHYVDKETLLAEALGISVAELQTAREADKSLSTLLDELGLDAATVRSNMQAAHESAVQQAVEDGVITQEQADQLGNGRFGKFGGRSFKGGRHHAPGQTPSTNSL